MELGDHGCPVRRDRLDEGLQVRRAHDVDGAAEEIRGERGAREGRVAAVRAAVDRYPPGIRPALADGERYGLDEVVLHPAAPLPVAGVDERLAVTGRAAEVDLYAEIAAVSEPSRLRIKTPDVACPRTAVHVEHGRQPVATRLRRERRVTMDGKAVSGGEGERLHGSELVTRQLRPLLEEHAAAAARPVVGEVRDGTRVVREPDQPRRVGGVTAQEYGIPLMKSPDRLEIRFERAVDDPVLRPVLEHDGDLRLAGVRVQPDADRKSVV